MFSIHAHAVAPPKAMFERAYRDLPAIHHVAQKASIEHVHGRVVEALEKEGLETDSVVVTWRKGVPYVGIKEGDEGDEHAAREFGTHEQFPSPVISPVINRSQDEAKTVFNHTLNRGVGIA